MPLCTLVPVGTTGSESSADLTRETIFDVLRNERRRYALHYLKQRTDPVDLGALAEQVAAWEEETAVEDLPSAARQRVYISLLQTHLPMMDDRDIVEFDQPRQTVELTDAAAAVDIYMEVVPADDIDWAEYYLGVAVFNAALLYGVWQDVYPLVAVPDAGWGLFVAAVFLLATLVHHHHHQRTQIGTPGPPTN